MSPWAKALSDTLRAIPPGDRAEEAVRAQALAIAAGDTPLCRIDVDTPDPHLVSYVLVTDGRQLLLVDHIKSGYWLPTGGHVEPGEHPRDAARREAHEELGLEGELLSADPVFVTLQQTNGARPHHDLSLWYVMRGDPGQTFDWDRGEFRQIKWHAPGEIPLNQSDPNMPRFLDKLHKLGLLQLQESAT
ncbi:MAG: NUDIX hydrolase [Pelagimonas sp.]|jgi:8-oxo-dGTP pyrophosphatase MutT (NUDIX family)|nr:NUDIX hydrolase [Pelagimonas sp.]